jgi:hypothetical protein
MRECKRCDGRATVVKKKSVFCTTCERERYGQCHDVCGQCDTPYHPSADMRPDHCETCRGAHAKKKRMAVADTCATPVELVCID